MGNKSRKIVHETKFKHPVEYNVPELKDRISGLETMVGMLSTAKNVAYSERNEMVAAFTHLFPSHLAKHPDDDKNWEKDWRNIVCIHTPLGQLSWHIHDSEVKYFKHLKEQPNDWDGHSTDQKYDRLEKLSKNMIGTFMCSHCFEIIKVKLEGTTAVTVPGIFRPEKDPDGITHHRFVCNNCMEKEVEQKSHENSLKLAEAESESK